MLKNPLKYFSFLLILLLVGCAKRGAIDGGAKDTIAPVLKVSFPKNYSVNFKEKTIHLTFDEYVKLKTVEKYLIISPPMKEMPEITPSSASKEIFIKFKDSLKENTTYSLNFGKSIEDNNEGNPYKEFKYVFSTGTYIDSLKLNGKIKDAYDKKLGPNMSLLLYEANEKFNDSIIYNENPRYVTKTVDSATVFQFENLKAGKYFLIALRDENSNNKFDPKNEKVGFVKNPITVPNDTIFEIELFKEVRNFTSFKPSQASGNRLTMGYEGDPRMVKAEIKNGNETIPNIITKLPEKDSIQIWYKPLKADSLSVAVTNGKYIKDYFTKIKNEKNDSLVISSKQSRDLPFRSKLTLKSSIPLSKFDQSKMQLINKDSVTIAYTTEYKEWDQELEFDFQKEPNEKYKLKLLPGALTDYMERTNDTLAFTYQTKSTADYGNLNLTLQNVKHFPIIVELTNEKGTIIASEYSESSSKIDFKLVEPNLFTVRVIYDTNKNKEWDPGNYLEKRQSEEVVYFPKAIDVRANWDVEQTINLSQ